MSVIRAKMEVATVLLDGYSEIVKLRAVYGGSTNAEDNTYASATPSGSIELTINNKGAMGKLKPGAKFYVDFTEVPTPEVKPA